MGDLLIAKVGDESGRGKTYRFVVATVGLAKLNNQSSEKEFSNRRNFGVYNRGESGVNWSERERSSLCFHDRATIQSLSSYQIFAKQLGYNHLDIGSVDLILARGVITRYLIDETIDTLLQRFPSHPLIFLASLIRELSL